MSNTTDFNVVPVNVAAFCVGKEDSEAVKMFAGSTVQNSRGKLESRDLRAAASVSLQAGVHLHWTLPEAVTKALSKADGSLVFPNAPNNWLVTRIGIAANGDVQKLKSWLVESDFLTTTGLDGKTLVLVEKKKGKPCPAALGRQIDLDKVKAQDKADYLTTGLTAVSGGQPHFAAYYPDCRGVFGLHDDLQDIGDAQRINYVVIGWHVQRPNADANGRYVKMPASSDSTKVVHQASPPEDELYSGFVFGIDPSKTKESFSANSVNSTDAKVAVGNTPGEALSAYFRHTLQPDNVLFEQLLTALQLGRLDQLGHPESDQLTKLGAALHNAQFRALDGGAVHTVRRNPSEASHGDAVHPHDLPPTMRAAVHRYNSQQQEQAELDRRRESLRWRLLTDWYRYLRAEEAQQGEQCDMVFNHAMELIAAYEQLSANRADKDSAAKQLKSRIDGQHLATLRARPPSRHHVSGNLKASNGAPDTYGLAATAQAPRYWQPTEPVVLLAIDNKGVTVRKQATPPVIRKGNEISSDVKVGEKTFSATADNDKKIKDHLGMIKANTAVAGVSARYDMLCKLLSKAYLFSSAARNSRAEDMIKAMADTAATWWTGNPWIPLFLLWEVRFHPLLPTDDGDQALRNYPVDYFLANYQVDPSNNGSFVADRPAEGAKGMDRRAALAREPQIYSGHTYLSASAARNLVRHIEQHKQDFGAADDATLTAMLSACSETLLFAQPLAGFNDALLLREAGLMQQISPPTMNDGKESFAKRRFAYELFPIPEKNSGSGDSLLPLRHTQRPVASGSFNPIRGGYFSVKFELIDAFGQRRRVETTHFYPADSMVSPETVQAAESLAYLAPRLIQPARLLFEWLSAGVKPAVTHNAPQPDPLTHPPKSSPVCGWLLPNHLAVGFFVFTAGGRPLGTLELDGGRVTWRPAPGVVEAADSPSVTTAMAHAHPLLGQLVLRLAGAVSEFFEAFWSSVNAAQSMVNPDHLATEGGLSVLIGRPLAIAQAGLSLDLHGLPVLNPSDRAITPDGVIDTDHGFTEVAFPVVLGDLHQHDDGLIGYFVEQGHGYDLNTFYSAGASEGKGAGGGVVRPSAGSLTLTPTPGWSSKREHWGQSSAHRTKRVLLLVDPRAKIHAATGILPTQTLRIPPEDLRTALATLEMWFPIGPVLQSAGSFMALPVPREDGYVAAWLARDEGQAWRTEADIEPPAIGPVAGHTPLALAEGWLRFNPDLLEFNLRAESGGPILVGKKQNLNVSITNRKAAKIKIKVNSKISIHLGDLLGAMDATSINLPQVEDPDQRWEASKGANADKSILDISAVGIKEPGNDCELLPGASWKILLKDVEVTAHAAQAHVYFDYFDVEGLPNGVHVDTVALHS